MLPRSIPLSLLLLVAAALFFSTQVFPAYAFDTTKLGQRGSLLPEDKEALFKKSAKLNSEVAAEMKKLGKTIEEIPCDGMRFPGSWVELGGLRVSPYICQFGERWLQIRTKVVVTGKRGRVYEQTSPEAMKQAQDVRETNPTWTWSDKEPAE
jgi:hypothetical protein